MSLCNFPVYEAYFGWSKPFWVASARMSYKNLVAFSDTKEGDGIEAWINLDQSDMSRIEPMRSCFTMSLQAQV